MNASYCNQLKGTCIEADEFGGKKQFEIQKQNDDLKRKYAAEHGIILLEIPYKKKKYENVKVFLKDNDII